MQAQYVWENDQIVRFLTWVRLLWKIDRGSRKDTENGWFVGQHWIGKAQIRKVSHWSDGLGQTSQGHWFVHQQFRQIGHNQLDKVRARQRHILGIWDHLNWLKAQKERRASKVPWASNCSSASVTKLTTECSRKITQLDTAKIGPDVKIVQALQKQHQHLHCEQATVEEKVRKVDMLAISVKNTYPNELS